MGAKVVWYREAWWVRTHYQGRKRDRRFGPSKTDKRHAEEIARKVNAAIELGSFELGAAPKPLPCLDELRRWHETYSPTFKPSFEIESARIIERHLAPHFGSRDLREISDEHLLSYVRLKLDVGLAPATIQTHLSVLRRVLSLAVQRGDLVRNPAARLGELMRRVGRRTATEASAVDTWTETEIETLLALAGEHEPRIRPALVVLFSTGMRRGELLGLKWEDVDFARRRIAVRRAHVRTGMTTPKNGRGRFIAMAPALGEQLLDLLAQRRRECLQRGWADVPDWVFPSETGGLLHPDNFQRTWLRLRRRARKHGVRPLKLHCTRHTWASRAVAAGKSVRWVADQLGHASPMLTLKTYAHAMNEEAGDLSFAEFGSGRVSGRLQTSPATSTVVPNEEAPGRSDRGPSGNMERETGFEPATSTLATWCSTS